jgi:hypothetical protein
MFSSKLKQPYSLYAQASQVLTQSVGTSRRSRAQELKQVQQQQLQDSGVLYGVWQLIAGLIVPESLAVDKERARASTRAQFERLALRRAQLRVGDLILVRTPGTFYRVFRGIAQHAYDHVGIVVSPGRFLHIGPPRIRLLPVELLLAPKRCAVVLRPQLSTPERNRLLGRLGQLVGRPYNTLRVYSFVGRLGARKFLGLQRKFKKKKKKKLQDQQDDLDEATTKHICTDAILNSLLVASPAFRSATQQLGSRLDVNVFNSWSINDVLRMHEEHPQLLRAVALPDAPPLLGSSSSDYRRSWLSSLRHPSRRLRRVVNDPKTLAVACIHLYQRSHIVLKTFLQTFLLTSSGLPPLLNRVAKAWILYTFVRSLFEQRRVNSARSDAEAAQRRRDERRRQKRTIRHAQLVVEKKQQQQQRQKTGKKSKSAAATPSWWKSRTDPYREDHAPSTILSRL